MSSPCTYGGYKTCACCGKVFYVLRPELWAYKRASGPGDKGKILYFHTYSCKKKYDDERDRKRKAHYDAANKKRLEKVKGRTCGECRYFMYDDKHNIYTCTCGISLCIFARRSACRKFKERFDEQPKL